MGSDEIGSGDAISISGTDDNDQGIDQIGNKRVTKNPNTDTDNHSKQNESQPTLTLTGDTTLTASEVTFAITVDSAEAYTFSEQNETSFTYQPSTLWIETETGKSFPLLQSPNSTHGLIPHENINEDCYKPSLDFWHSLINYAEEANKKEKVPLEISEQKIPIHERYLIHTLITRTFSPHYQTPQLFKFIFAYGKKEIASSDI